MTANIPPESRLSYRASSTPPTTNNIGDTESDPVCRNRKKVPLTMAYCGDHHTLVTASADMTLLQWYLDDIPSIKHFTLKSRWPTKHAAMSMCWSSSHRLLYSGTTAGSIQGRVSVVVAVAPQGRSGWSKRLARETRRGVCVLTVRKCLLAADCKHLWLRW